ncbi:hypothetical protein WP12_02950 [Sphingomonas sp. SRS2]|nr:hypothetical protein WP12_02950 [Sphingomonas sp. SRS2]
MRRLGLDIGTNSIGWCLTEDDSRIVDIGARIFSDGRDPQSGTSLAVDRREARAARRRRDRYLGRRSSFLEALVAHGLMPDDADEAQMVAQRDPYPLRARALDEKLAPIEIGRVLFHLNQRRGFKSNRKAERKSGDNEEGKIASAARGLDEAMAEAGTDTLGQFLAGLETKRVRMNGENQTYDFYPQRRHIEYEFGRIWEEQAKHHPTLLTDAARAELHRILFFQRPLKEQAIGICTFVHNEFRLARAHPLFQERRLYEEVNQLEITTPGAPNRKLKMDERDRLILKLRGVRAANFESLGRLLKLEPGQSFNKASETRTQLAGNEVHATLSDKKRFGNSWEHFDRARQWKIIERLMEEENPDTLHEFLTGECGLDDERADTTAKASLPEGYGRLGINATSRILDELKKEVITYAEAVGRAGWHHTDNRTGEILSQLPYYGELLTRHIPPGTQDPNDPPEKRWGKITNPTVHIGLRQLEKLMNAIITLHGRPNEIVVELARELKLNEKDKEEHNRRIRRDTAAAQARSKKLETEGFVDNGANRALLRIWEELNPANPLDRRCPYCGEPIGMRMLFSGEADIDHILPYSRTLDDSIGNKSEGNVYVIPGRMTAMLRRLWGLNSLLPDHNIVENKHSDAPKNRLDHRHHAIDAAVVAVTTRGLMQRIARTAGLAEDRNLDRLFEGLDQPWAGFREELGERLSAVVVSHKPDHGRKGRPLPGKDMTAGRLHNDTAYGLTGEVNAKGVPVVVHRVPLMSLKSTDLTDPDRIADKALRDALYRATEGSTGKDYEAALVRFAKQDRVFGGIRRIRVREPLNVITIKDQSGRVYKAYKGDANARFDVWQLPGGKWVSDVVPMFDAHQVGQADRRPHPAARKILSLHQNDMLAIERNGGPREIVRVVKFSTNGSLHLAPSTEAGPLKARDATPSDVDPFKYINSSAGGLKRVQARQVRVDPLGRIFDPGPR